jgi:ubiquinone/menaquinone biosynthesis C-methylase UbiE
MPGVAEVRQRYERLAGSYDRTMSVVERFMGFRDGRTWLCGEVAGRVLEIGIGTGRNLPYYPAGVSLTGIDLSPSMLERARSRAARLRIDVDLREGDVSSLPFPDASFDVVVSGLTLCTIPDPVAAVREALRVTAVRGEFRCMEHGCSSNRLVAAGQRALDPLAHRLEADNLCRDPGAIVTQAGGQIVAAERSRAGIVWRIRAVAGRAGDAVAGR